MIRILLTGASGFIGNRLLRHLCNAGISVVATGRTPVSGGGVHFLAIPRLNAKDLRSALQGQPIDALIHLAAAGVNPDDRDAQRLLEINGHLPVELTCLARDLGARAFVMTGSSSEYAQIDSEQIGEGASLETAKTYGATKAAGGLLAVAIGLTLGLPTVNLRLFNVFGPGEASHRLLPSLFESLSMGRPVLLSEGLQQRDFIHVDDACAAILAALNAALRGTLPTGHYNVCSGKGTSVRDFALSVASILGADTGLLRFGALPMRPDDVPRVVGAPDALGRATGWKPTMTFSQAIKSAVDEMRQLTSHA
ncbi:NAD-dependent epimerase/dehydratase family protein [Dyella humi]|uniref:NAD(P)-dependent oxidoreductase n=1 Tax=Dyella humi TaxID=1770547 RepID=A0ABW8IKU7_9GAMM